MTPVHVAVVMPAFNEASGIGEFLTEICNSFRSANVKVVFAVVDDYSGDRTGPNAEQSHVCDNCSVTVSRNSQNLGHGPSSVRAWQLGLSSDTSVVVHVDGDGQFSGHDIVRVAKACDTADGAIGVRRNRTDPWFRRLVTHALRHYIHLMSGVRIRDANSPLRAYQSEALEALLDTLPDAPLIPSIYLSVAGTTRNIEVVELDVISRDRLGDTATGSTWGESALPLMPTKRLVVFIWDAAIESVRVLHRLRARQPSAAP